MSGSPGRRGAGASGIEREGRLYTDGPPVSYSPVPSDRDVVRSRGPNPTRMSCPSFAGRRPAERTCRPLPRKAAPAGLRRPRRTVRRTGAGCSVSRCGVSFRPGGVFPAVSIGLRGGEGRQKLLRHGFLPCGNLWPGVAADKMWITSRGRFRRNPAIICFFAWTKEQYPCRCLS